MRREAYREKFPSPPEVLGNTVVRIQSEIDVLRAEIAEREKELEEAREYLASVIRKRDDFLYTADALAGLLAPGEPVEPKEE